MSDQPDWKIYRGQGDEHDDVARLRETLPPWRDFRRRNELRARTYKPTTPGEIELVNAALYLRRPLLVTGSPGSGKSSLAYAVARELKLGPVLRWPINSRSTLAEGLYGYDAIARLRDANLEREKGLTGERAKSEDIGSYIRLNWLGTALYPSGRPRALLIDEIDKSDIDLPNDLLHVFEEGDFEIPELVRIADLQPEVYVSTRDPNLPRAKIVKGQVQCQAFPFVLITSNGERDLPPAFFRRCLRLKIADADEEQLRQIIAAHLDQIDTTLAGPLIRQFVEKRRSGGLMANDQLLNALFLIDRGRLLEPKERDRLLDSLLRELNR